ncbi:hypothetical protein SAMN05216251_13157 [Actinacidiphila alni]|uniref:Secreted protein n=1 Tax=Actinacidiphila alni TaxID=380248 RepID=A0A1I2LZ53_9ACTN|nr:hypothetical protein [Actinacidiphila alni]SFF83838.1 hypothetical protein SAMN05216251_13157 [Actinacidiphila alni]
MARVHRGLFHVGAWALATAAAVTLSWFGVHSVLRTAYDPPRALPISDVDGPPVASSTHRPKPPATVTARTPTPGRTRTAPPTAGRGAAKTPPKTPPGTPKATASASGDTGNVHSYTVDGGRVALDLAPASASLVSATPNPGWKMQVWTQDGWLRVTFTQTSGSGSSSVFCTWNGHPPTVQAFED